MHHNGACDSYHPNFNSVMTESVITAVANKDIEQLLETFSFTLQIWIVGGKNTAQAQ